MAAAILRFKKFWDVIGPIVSSTSLSLSMISFGHGNSDLSYFANHQDNAVGITLATASIDPRDEGRGQDVAGKVDISLFNKYGQMVGEKLSTDRINAGNTAFGISYPLYKDYHGHQTPYIKLSSGTKKTALDGLHDAVTFHWHKKADVDPICIAWLTVSGGDGMSWVWDGSFGKACNKTPWHYNDAPMGSVQNEIGEWEAHIPTCAWIGLNGDSSSVDAISLYLPHYIPDNGTIGHDEKTFCNEPNFVLYPKNSENDIIYYDTPPAITNALQDVEVGVPEQKRDVPITLTTSESIAPTAPPHSLAPQTRLYTPAEHNTKVIESSHKAHSAIALCEHDLSYGHSFLSTLEAKFCDMTTKTLYDVCAPERLVSSRLFDSSALPSPLAAGFDTPCFDLASLALVGANASAKWLKYEKWTF